MHLTRSGHMKYNPHGVLQQYITAGLNGSGYLTHCITITSQTIHPSPAVQGISDWT